MDRILHKLNPALMERETLTSAEFPIFFVEDHLDESNRGGMEWRWHPDLEFNVVLKGTMEVYLDDTCLRLSAGQGILKNSNLLHRSVIAPGCRQAEMFNITMGAEFIAPAQSLLYQKYMAPIQGNHRLRFLPLYPVIPWQGEILGGTVIADRFSSWEKALSAARLPYPQSEDKPSTFLRVQQEEERQKEIYRQRKAQKKVLSEQRRIQQAAKRKAAEKKG